VTLETTLAAALAASPLAAGSAPAASFVEVLLAEGRPPAGNEGARLYDWLLGAWDVEVFDVQDDGSRRKTRGEWHFARVLEGRAIQDVFIVPARAERKHGEPEKPGNRYGTTIRVYDPATDRWHIRWFNPVTGAQDSLVARRQGEEILQEGKDDDGSPIRWVFSDITPRSFRWRGEVSSDGGKTWRLGAEFLATRRP
jgi:hypothetical protein